MPVKVIKKSQPADATGDPSPAAKATSPQKPAEKQSPVTPMADKAAIVSHEPSPVYKKAASAKATKKQGPAKAETVTLRFPPELLKQIDTAVADQAVKIPRHTWLLQAAVEKLAREG